MGFSSEINILLGGFCAWIKSGRETFGADKISVRDGVDESVISKL